MRLFQILICIIVISLNGVKAADPFTNKSILLGADLIGAIKSIEKNQYFFTVNSGFENRKYAINGYFSINYKGKPINNQQLNNGDVFNYYDSYHTSIHVNGQYLIFNKNKIILLFGPQMSYSYFFEQYYTASQLPTYVQSRFTSASWLGYGISTSLKTRFWKERIYIEALMAFLDHRQLQTKTEFRYSFRSVGIEPLEKPRSVSIDNIYFKLNLGYSIKVNQGNQ